MIETFRGIWRFAGEEQRNIRRSVIACFFNAVFHMFEIAAIYYTILALLDGKTRPATAWQALGLLAVSILGSAVTKYFSQLQQTHAGYFMAANKRVAIGQRMKSVPMGYFKPIINSIHYTGLLRFQSIGSVPVAALGHNGLLRDQFREELLGPRAFDAQEFRDIGTLCGNMIRQVSDDFLFLPR